MIKFIIGSWFGSMLVIVGGLSFPHATNLYKQGQIDAMNGVVYFQLVKLSDGTTAWVRK
jgi:hypothetical protein